MQDHILSRGRIRNIHVHKNDLFFIYVEMGLTNQFLYRYNATIRKIKENMKKERVCYSPSAWKTSSIIKHQLTTFVFYIREGIPWLKEFLDEG